MVHLSEIEHSDLLPGKHQVFAYVFNYMKRRKVSPWKVNGFWYGQPLCVEGFLPGGNDLKIRHTMLACYDRLLFPAEVERGGLIPYFSLLPLRNTHQLTTGQAPKSGYGPEREKRKEDEPGSERVY